MIQLAIRVRGDSVKAWQSKSLNLTETAPDILIGLGARAVDKMVWKMSEKNGHGGRNPTGNRFPAGFADKPSLPQLLKNGGRLFC